jgi:hypothetical protein
MKCPDFGNVYNARLMILLNKKKKLIQDPNKRKPECVIHELTYLSESYEENYR